MRLAILGVLLLLTGCASMNQVKAKDAQDHFAEFVGHAPSDEREGNDALTCWQQAVQENPHTAASIVSLIHGIIQEQERSRDFKQCLERQGYQRGKPS